jgi:hypothetical protein
VLGRDHAEKLDESAFSLRHLFLSQESGSRGLLELLNVAFTISIQFKDATNIHIKERKFPKVSFKIHTPKAIPDVTTPLS